MADTTTPSKKTILIIGGSYGGLSIAHYTLKHIINQLPDSKSYQVVIVSTSSQALCRPACPRALISDDMFDQKKLFVSITEQLAQYPKDQWQFIHGTATQLDHENRTATVKIHDGQDQIIPFYALVIATGATTVSPLFSFTGAETSLRTAWTEFRKALPTAKSIVIAGGGPTGVETAGELGEYLNGPAGWFSSANRNPKVNITLVTSGASILPLLRSALAQKAETYLASLGVTVLKDTKVTAVSPEDSGASLQNLASPTSITLSTGETLNADIYIPATGSKPNTSFLSASLLNSAGALITSPETLRVGTAGQHIYSIGDSSSAFRPAIHNIMAAVPILGANIKRDLMLDAGMTGVEVRQEKNFEEDTREMQLVPVGRKKGVGAVMGWRVPSFMVWAIKGRDYWLWTTGKLWSGRQWAKEG